jgi:hypothetical protein
VRSRPLGTRRRGTIARLVLPGLILGLAAAAVPAQERGGEGRGPPAEDRAGGRGGRTSYANPTAAIAADLAVTRMAREEGEWAALLDRAAVDAVVLTPQPAWAQTWLKGRAQPAVPSVRQPVEVWASCDGALAVTRGLWSRGSDTGWFATVWQRQADGGWKWQFTDAGRAAVAVEQTDMLQARVADCPAGRGADAPPRGGKRPSAPKPPKFRDLPPLDPASRTGASPDGSLRWEARLGADGLRRLTVTWKKDGAEAVALAETAGPEPLFR